MGTDSQSWRLPADAGALVLAGAFGVTVVLIVLLLPLLRRHALAQPNARSSHVSPTPQGGGIAVVAGALLAMAGVALSSAALWSAAPWGAEIVPADPAPALVALGVVILAVTGLVDDVRPLPPGPRLALQVLAAGLVVAALPAEPRLMASLPPLAERLALGLALVWFVNLVNFMDGIDWMTVAQMVPMTAALALLAGLGALPAAAGLAALALLGALLGFAPFNRPTARLFLGDVGSLPIGLATGWLLSLLAVGGHVAAAVLLPLYYVADATITLLRRLARGERVWEAHRTHFYQRAVANGLTVPQVVGRVAAVNVALAALAVGTVLWPGAPVGTAAVAAGGGMVAALLADFCRGRSGDLPSRGAP